MTTFLDFIRNTVRNKGGRNKGYIHYRYKTEYDGNGSFELYHYGSLIASVDVKKKEITYCNMRWVSEQFAVADIIDVLHLTNVYTVYRCKLWKRPDFDAWYKEHRRRSEIASKFYYEADVILPEHVAVVGDIVCLMQRGDTELCVDSYCFSKTPPNYWMFTTSKQGMSKIYRNETSVRHPKSKILNLDQFMEQIDHAYRGYYDIKIIERMKDHVDLMPDELVARLTEMAFSEN